MAKIKVIPGENDLATTHPKVAQDADGWDPKTITAGSSEKRDWKCDLGHTWSSVVASRTRSKPCGCPYCGNRKVLAGFNDLASKYPDVAEQAHGWDPRAVVATTHKKFEWICEAGHTWTAAVAKRVPPQNTGCPYCANRLVLAGFNDLATTHPEMAKEADGWDPAKVGPGSTKRLNWKCKKGHARSARPVSRTAKKKLGLRNKDAECPFCTNRKVLAGFNDLATTHPDIANEADGWDPTTIGAGSNIRLPWKCELGHTWLIAPNKRTCRGDGCPYCANVKLMTGFNDLATRHPEIAEQADGWDPSTVMDGSNKKLAWKCSEGHTWFASVYTRLPPQNCGCPFCGNQRLWVGFNDLATRYPELAKQAYGWDPSTQLAGSHKKLKWQCEEGHTWSAEVVSRLPPASSGCPFCAEYGYQRDKPGFIYLMQRTGEQQIGITNQPEVRLATHERVGWELIELSGPHPGEVAWQREREIRDWLRESIGTMNKTHENWSDSLLKVTSLGDLYVQAGLTKILRAGD